MAVVLPFTARKIFLFVGVLDIHVGYTVEQWLENKTCEVSIDDRLAFPLPLLPTTQCNRLSVLWKESTVSVRISQNVPSDQT